MGPRRALLQRSFASLAPSPRGHSHHDASSSASPCLALVARITFLWRLPGLCVLGVAICPASVIVTSGADLQTCLSNPSVWLCEIPADTTLSWPSALSYTSSHTIQGSGNSVIDLNLNASFMTQYGNLTIVDVTIVNGASISGYAPLFTIGPGSFTNFTNVVVRDFTGGDWNMGTIYGQEGTGYFRNVTFQNIQNVDSGVFFVQDLNWHFEDVSFIQCDSQRAHSFQYPILLFFPAWTTAGSHVTFAGDLIFTNNSLRSTNPVSLIDLFVNNNAPGPITLTSSTERPPRFIFENNAGSIFSTYALLPSNITIDLNYIEVRSHVVSTMLTSDAYLFHINIQGQNAGAFNNISVNQIVSKDIPFIYIQPDYTRSQGNTEIVVKGDANITVSSSTGSAIATSSHGSITAKNLYLHLANDTQRASNTLPTAVAAFIANPAFGIDFSIAVENNFIVTSSLFCNDPTAAVAEALATSVTPGAKLPTVASPPTAGDAAITAYFGVNLEITATNFAVMGHKRAYVETPEWSLDSPLNGGAISVLSAGTRASINASKIMRLGYNVVDEGRGGAVYMEADTQLLLSAGTAFLVDHNEAVIGGAMHVASATNSSNFQLSPAVHFYSNRALIAGGAVAVSNATNQNFANATFTQSSAGQYGCVVAYGDAPSPSQVCPTSGSFLYLSQSDNAPISRSSYNLTDVCLAEEFMCEAQCTTTPPSSLAVCKNGIWTISVDNLPNNPDTPLDAPVTITGGAFTTTTIAITNIFSPSSTGAFITSDSCVTINNLQITLSKQDVEALEKAGTTTANLISSPCPTVSIITLKGAKPSKSCKQVQAKTNTNTPSLLQATFQLNASKCNVWWIVLVCVLGGIIIIVAAIIIAFRASPKLRAQLQPFWRSNA